MDDDTEEFYLELIESIQKGTIDLADMPATKQTLINAFQPLLAEQLSETQEDMANALSDLKQKAVPEELLKPVRGAIAKLQNAKNDIANTTFDANEEIDTAKMKALKEIQDENKAYSQELDDKIAKANERHNYWEVVLSHFGLGISIAVPYGLVFGLLWHLFMK